MKKPKSVDEYIRSYPREVQILLEKVRTAIQEAAPQAKEVVSYSMPAFELNGMLVWYAAHSNHIGFYPRVSGMEAFKKELSIYKTSKGAVQFPFDNPLPLGLIKKMVKFRVAEKLVKDESKKIK